jgi:hypothetical protein
MLYYTTYSNDPMDLIQVAVSTLVFVNEDGFRDNPLAIYIKFVVVEQIVIAS